MYCAQCGFKNSSSASFCQKCGKPIAAQAVIESTGEYVGSNCPYCQTPIKPGVEVMVCPSCGIPHHKECWIANNETCTTFGCNGLKLAQPQLQPSMVILPVVTPVSAMLQRKEVLPNSHTVTGGGDVGRKKKYFVVATVIVLLCSVGAFGLLKLGWGKPQGVVIADEVILRGDPSVVAGKLGEMGRGDKVRIQEEWKSTDPKEAIVIRDGLEIDYRGSALKIQKGQAVYIDGQLGKDYLVRFNIDKQWVTRPIEPSWLRRISGTTWYRVRTERSDEGWILSDFVRVDK